jgi:hypothetical protein
LTRRVRHVVVNEVQIIVRAACFGCPVVSAKLVHDSTARPGLAAERLEGITEPTVVPSG